MGRWLQEARERARMARLLRRMHRSGLNIAQVATVLQHYHRRGQLALLYAEWEV